MKRTPSKFLSLLLALALLSALAAGVYAEDYTLTLSSDKLSLKVGAQGNLTATVTPAETPLTWTSSDPTVASVNSAGVVTANNVGTATVRVAVTAHPETYQECAVTVTRPIASVTMSPTLELTVGGEGVPLAVTISPADASEPVYTWTNTDPTVARMSGSGDEVTVTPLAAGSTTITVRVAAGGDEKEASCVVTVSNPVAVGSVTITSPLALELKKGDTSTLSAVISPSGAQTWPLTWKISDPSVVSVASDNRTLQALDYGTAKVTASAGGVDSGAPIDVVVSGVTLSISPSVIYEGQRATLTIVPHESATGVNTWTAAGGSGSGSVSVISTSGSSLTKTVVGETAGSTSVTVRGTATVSRQSITYDASIPVEVRSTTITAPTMNTGDMLRFSTLTDRIADISQNVTGSTLSYLTGINVSSTEGTLYYNYAAESDTGSGVASLNRYYLGGGNMQLGDVTFIPKPGYSGTATVTYTGYAVDGSAFHSRILIPVTTNAGNGELGALISYTTLEASPVRFSGIEFSEQCQALNGRALRYVNFTLPQSTLGTLKFKLIEGDLYESTVSSGTRYYRSGTPSIDDVYFIPRNGFSGNVDIPFVGVDTAGSTLNGTVRISVSSSQAPAGQLAEIDYNVESGQRIYLDPGDFSTACRRCTGRELNFITLGSGATATTRGRLQYNSADVTATTMSYYLTSTGSRRLIGNLSYLAKSGTAERVSIDFIGTDDAGTVFEGKIRITVTTKENAVVNYAVTPGGEVFFNTSDFSDLSYLCTDRDLNYIVINQSNLPVASHGYLFDPGGVVTTRNTYYRTASNSRKLVADLSFVAASDFEGTFGIPFTGYSTAGKSFVGCIFISVPPSTAESNSDERYDGTLMYTTMGPAVAFRKSDFIAAARDSLPRDLSYVRFSAPSATMGRLCRNYVSPTHYSVLDTNQTWPVNALSNISFLPHAGFTGTVSIGFTAYDVGGNRYDDEVRVIVVPPLTSNSFRDMYSAPWAVTAVDFLNYYDILTGTGSGQFSPGMQMRRCDFVLMLSRAFSFGPYGTYSFSDVPAGAYYSSAIASAKALGIVAGDTAGNFNPTASITRQEAAVMLYRSMRRIGNMPIGSASDLRIFSDAWAVSDYAVEAMGSLVRLGVFQGDGTGRVNPWSPLTRAEMASLFYRAIT